MGRRSIGTRALTGAERTARWRERLAREAPAVSAPPSDAAWQRLQAENARLRAELAAVKQAADAPQEAEEARAQAKAPSASSLRSLLVEGIRDDEDDLSDLRESMQLFGWIEGHPAI